MAMMDEQQVRVERGVRWLYWWLMGSAFITVPWMAVGLALADARGSSYVTAVFWPVLIHILVLPWKLRSPYLFVRRHTQQAAILVGLRTLSAIVFIGFTQGDAACVWFLVNGNLWLWGTVWGLRQMKRGDCWLMRRKGEMDELPRTWAEGVEKTEPSLQANQTETLPDTPQASLWFGQTLLAEGQQREAVPYFLAAFRQGTADLRQQAVVELERLDEVELF